MNFIDTSKCVTGINDDRPQPMGKRTPTFNPLVLEPGIKLAALKNNEVWFSVAANCPVRRAFTLTRVPTASGIKVDGSWLQVTERGARFTPDVPGLYIVTHDLGGGYKREYDVVVFENANFRALGQWLTMHGFNHFQKMNQIVNDPKATRGNIVEALEISPTENPRVLPLLHGPLSPVILQGFGCPGFGGNDEFESELERKRQSSVDRQQAEQHRAQLKSNAVERAANFK